MKQIANHLRKLSERHARKLREARQELDDADIALSKICCLNCGYELHRNDERCFDCLSMIIRKDKE